MKFLVIGAGAAGLSSIKCCLDEGVEVECFEQGQDIGGLWKYSELEGHSSIYESTVINTSKEMSCFSDFPMPKEFAPFLPHYMMFRYYELFVERFGLRKYIRFNCKVLDVKKTEDHDTTGKWEVICQHLTDDGARIEERRLFDGVLVCSGHLWQPRMPTYPGIDDFKGRILHSHSYKNTKGFEGKTVLLIGLGNSAADIAVDLSHHAKKVFISTRKGALLMSRTIFGIPFDYFVSNRAFHNLPSWLSWLLFELFIIKHINYKHYGLQTITERSKGPFVINDALHTRISTGTIAVKSDVAYFGDRSATFVDNTTVENLDAVVFCTGYLVGFDFLDESIISPPPNNDLMLYKYVFPPREPKSTLAFIGFITIMGAMNPTMEMQARWALAVFKGTIRLPSQDEMLREIRQTREQLFKGVENTPRNSLVAKGIPYVDSLSQQIGCKPNILRLLFSDPVLAFRCFFGPLHPAQYRLCGPGKWPGARKAILEVYSNLVYPTMTRTVEPKPYGKGNLEALGYVIKFAVISIAVLIVFKCAYMLSLDTYQWIFSSLIALVICKFIFS